MNDVLQMWLGIGSLIIIGFFIYTIWYHNKIEGKEDEL